MYIYAKHFARVRDRLYVWRYNRKGERHRFMKFPVSQTGILPPASRNNTLQFRFSGAIAPNFVLFLSFLYSVIPKTWNELESRRARMQKKRTVANDENMMKEKVEIGCWLRRRVIIIRSIGFPGGLSPLLCKHIE